jgi:hypothetical protein
LNRKTLRSGVVIEWCAVRDAGQRSQEHQGANAQVGVLETGRSRGGHGHVSSHEGKILAGRIQAAPLPNVLLSEPHEPNSLTLTV